MMTTCLVDALFPDVGKAVVTVLERLGHEVLVPEGQACCGQMHINTGYVEEALPVVRNQISSLTQVEADAVVAPSGSCVGSVRHQHVNLARNAGDDALADQAQALSDKTYEFSELLVDVLGVTDVGAYFPHTVTYHPTCHSLRMLRVGDKPLRLLQAVDGLDLVELPGAQECCGFGGTFALKNEPVSSAMLADKVAAVQTTGADICSTSDSSCLMHIGGGLSRLETGVGTRHLAQILASTRTTEAINPTKETRASA